MNKGMLGQLIIEHVGGINNIAQVSHCFTRLRLILNQEDKVNVDKIKALDGVMGCQFKGGQFQVIIGNDVGEVFSAIVPLLKENVEENAGETNLFERIIGLIARIFTPALAAITGAGMLKAVIALLLLTGGLTENSSSHELLNMISDAPFHFLPFLLAVTAARCFNTNEYLALTLAGVMMYPSFMGKFDMMQTQYLELASFIKIPVVNYASSVIPIILGVFLLSLVYKKMDQWIPNMFRLIITPMVTLLIVVPITLVALGPIGYYLGTYLEMTTTWLFTNTGPFAGLVFGAIASLVVMTGMHYAFLPGTFNSLNKFGYDIMLLPMMLVNNVAQGGAALAVALRTKNKDLKALAISTGLTAVVGITEPAMYGVTLKYKRPFYAAMIGASIGCGFASYCGLKMFGFALPGILALPLFIDETSNNLLYAIISASLGFFISFILSFILGIKEEIPEQNKHVNTDIPLVAEVNANLASPISGRLHALHEVNDEAFSRQMLGKGVAIMPYDGALHAPFDGEVMSILPHAIGLQAENGIELLIHVGIDSVKFGHHFQTLVEVGDKVITGQKLMNFDIEGLKRDDVDLMTPVIVLNSDNYLDVIPFELNEIQVGNPILSVIK